jgi:uncharacterized protein (TIRG00374 family)
MAFALAHNQRWMEIVRAVAREKNRTLGDFLSFFRWLMNSYVVGMIVPTDLSLAGLRVFYMSRSKVLVPEVGLFSVLLDRAFDLLIFALFALASILYFGGLLSGTAAMILLGFLVALVLAVFTILGGRSITLILRAYRWAFGMFRYLPFLKERLGGDGSRPGAAADFRRSAIAGIVLLSVVKYLCMVLRFYFLGQAFGTGLSLFHALLVVPLVQAAFMVSITPGGLGIVELGTYGALRLAGVADDHILLFVVGQRVIVSSTVLGTALVAHLAGILWSWAKGGQGQGAHG